MKTTSIALLAAAATCLLPFVTPAIAELGHPSGCASCEPVEVTAPTEGYDNEGAPRIRPLLSIGAPAGATALAPKAGVAGHSPPRGVMRKSGAQLALVNTISCAARDRRVRGILSRKENRMQSVADRWSKGLYPSERRTMAELNMPVFLGASMVGLGADAQDAGGLVAPELSRPI